jgi:LEA14-like dessication related protein
MKKGWIIAIVLLLLGIAGAYIWYSRLKNEAASEKGPYDNTLKPRLEMTTMEITEIDDDQITMNVKLLVDNPLPIGFQARRLSYTVLIANTPVVEDAYEKPITVESGDSTLVTLPVRVINKKLLTVLNTLDQKDIDSTNYTVRCRFDLDVPIVGERTFTQTITRRMPTVYLPKIEIDDIDFGKLGLKKTDVAAKVNVTNKNNFPFQFTDAHYTVAIDGKEIAEGEQTDPIIIKKQGTTPVVFPVTVKPGQSIGLLPKMLFDKKDTPFVVTFRCKIITKDDNPMLSNSKMKALIKGTLADLKRD